MWRSVSNKQVLPKWHYLVFIITLFISCNGDETKMSQEATIPAKRVLVLGASVGKAWNIEALPKRLQDYAYQYEFIPKYKPDKSDILEQALNRKENKPDVIIIKQCAAYFRRDTQVYQPEHVQRYKQFAEAWVMQCKTQGVEPILATVVPITAELPFKMKLKRLVKKYILQKDIGPGYRSVRLTGILDYNDWVTAYAEKNGLTVLDLEAAVRVSDDNRYLNPDFTTDGLKLKKKGYRRLDPLLPKAIKQTIN